MLAERLPERVYSFMDKVWLRRSEQIYAALLKFYPERYRQEFGEEMSFVFSESLKDAYTENSGQGIVILWTRIVLDTGKSLMIQHLENLKGGDSLKTKNTNILIQNKNIFIVALVTAILLLVPLLAMQFGSQVHWSLFDFLTAGALIFGTGLAFELIIRRRGNLAYRLAVGVALGAAFLLIWISIAVGIIGSENNPANLMYAGVLGVGIIGAVIARLKPGGMARTMFAVAAAQLLVGALALLMAGWENTLILNVVFSAMWVVSALLFRRARG